MGRLRQGNSKREAVLGLAWGAQRAYTVDMWLQQSWVVGDSIQGLGGSVMQGWGLDPEPSRSPRSMSREWWAADSGSTWSWIAEGQGPKTVWFRKKSFHFSADSRGGIPLSRSLVQCTWSRHLPGRWRPWSSDSSWGPILPRSRPLAQHTPTDLGPQQGEPSPSVERVPLSGRQENRSVRLLNCIHQATPNGLTPFMHSISFQPPRPLLSCSLHPP